MIDDNDNDYINVALLILPLKTLINWVSNVSILVCSSNHSNITRNIVQYCFLWA